MTRVTGRTETWSALVSKHESSSKQRRQISTRQADGRTMSEGHDPDLFLSEVHHSTSCSTLERSCHSNTSRTSFWKACQGFTSGSARSMLRMTLTLASRRSSSLYETCTSTIRLGLDADRVSVNKQWPQYPRVQGIEVQV